MCWCGGGGEGERGTFVARFHAPVPFLLTDRQQLAELGRRLQLGGRVFGPHALHHGGQLLQLLLCGGGGREGECRHRRSVFGGPALLFSLRWGTRRPRTPPTHPRSMHTLSGRGPPALGRRAEARGDARAHTTLPSLQFTLLVARVESSAVGASPNPGGGTPPPNTARFFCRLSSRLALRSSTMLVSRLRRASSASRPRWNPFLRSAAPPRPDMARGEEGGWGGVVVWEREWRGAERPVFHSMVVFAVFLGAVFSSLLHTLHSPSLLHFCCK